MMTDTGTGNCSEQDGDMERKHKKERKELQAKVTNLKRSMAKGDKKKKREITEEIAKLEADLERRHDIELAGDHSTQDLMKVEALSLNEESSHDTTSKISKAQKRRNKKAQQEKDRDDLIKEQETLNLTGERHIENEKLKSMLVLRGLQYYEIPSDGDCLYGAVGHQLSQHGIVMNISDLRRKTAEFIRQNKNEFAPFLCNQETDLPFTDEMFQEYCDEIESTTVWGGQLELRAISQVLKRPIEILQAEGQHLILGEEFTTEPLIVTYHRHAYKLGEHYNSVAKVSETCSKDEVY